MPESPVKRSWAILFYMVAEPYSGKQLDGLSGVPLDDVADAELAAIKTAASAYQQGATLHVAYQVVARNAAKRAVNGVEEDIPPEDLPDNDDDLRMFTDFMTFLGWASPKCPADHYAVFLWGHSMGPGGMFDLYDATTMARVVENTGESASTESVGSSATANGSPSSLAESAGASTVVRSSPARGRGTGGGRPGAGGSEPDAPRGGEHGRGRPGRGRPGDGRPEANRPGHERPRRTPVSPQDKMKLSLQNFRTAMSVRFREPTAEFHQPQGYTGDTTSLGKIDLLVFKNCFMSALEVAAELESVAKLVIGSQSQVPIWSKKEDDTREPGVWPYDDLFSCFADHSVPVNQQADLAMEAGRDVLTKLGSFYWLKKNRAVFSEVPYTLLNLSQIDAVITALNNVSTRLIGTSVNGWLAAFESAATGPLNGAAGNIALVDIKRLCVQLRPFAQQQVSLLEAAVQNLIIEHKTQKRTNVPCQGVSAFHFPSLLRRQDCKDDYLLHDQIIPYNYSNLTVGTGDWYTIAWKQNT